MTTDWSAPPHMGAYSRLLCTWGFSGKMKVKTSPKNDPVTAVRSATMHNAMGWEMPR